MKIAIYSGDIPSSTFIENLIKGISTKHEVVLFGKLLSKPMYTSKNIQCFPSYSNKLKNLIITKWRTFILLLKYPIRFKILWNQVKPIEGIYYKFQWWSRYVPVLLQLPDIFHVQWAKDLEKWYFLKEKLGCKLMLSLRGAHINYSPIAISALAAMYKTYFPKIDGFHAVSDEIGREAQKYGADATKIKTIHSLIPQNTFDLFKSPRDNINSKLNVISVGRHHWIKGYSMALDACKILKENNIGFKYSIIAAGDIPEDLVFQRHQLGLLEEVIFENEQPQEKVLKKMQDSDVLLLPSLKEGIANVVLEAMAIGLPVITTDCGGMREVVKHKETGWLVPVLDEQVLADTLIEVFNSSLKKRQEIVKKAHEVVKKQFNQNDGITQFNKLYAEIYKIK